MAIEKRGSLIEMPLYVSPLLNQQKGLYPS